ncbi:hypothetical protein [Serinicoccus sediminis]|uniref:hypothetical protein n=1 Tax=Serinicoccus sediminis TaxID=2306021 RepID=UPI00102107EE|nr:hypothetical protein [Serinicoccus sediminis]
MSRPDTVSRVLHDPGAAAWSGGSLIGAVGLNQASGVVTTGVTGAGLGAWQGEQRAGHAARGVLSTCAPHR